MPFAPLVLANVSTILLNLNEFAMSGKSERTAAVPIGTEPKTMQAVVYDDYGDPSVLHFERIPVPERITGEVLIEVHATSVNPIDYRLRRGELKGILPGGFPRVPGYDVAGVVVDCEDGDPLNLGDRVMAFLRHARGGACAEFASCAIDAVAKLPASICLWDHCQLAKNGKPRPNCRATRALTAKCF